MAVSTRTRFEILKRDGFRCRYCGVNAASSPLHVDHVVALANGGSDDQENLVTACADCNLGKSDIPLESRCYAADSQRSAISEHAEQVRWYLESVRELRDARQALVDEVVMRWRESINERGMDRSVENNLPGFIERLGLENVLHAVDAVAQAWNVRSSTDQRRYFLAVLRNMKNEGRGVDQ